MRRAPGGGLGLLLKEQEAPCSDAPRGRNFQLHGSDQRPVKSAISVFRADFSKASTVEVAQDLFGIHIPGGLPDDGAQCSGIDFPVIRDGERLLFAVGSEAPQARHARIPAPS